MFPLLCTGVALNADFTLRVVCPIELHRGRSTGQRSRRHRRGLVFGSFVSQMHQWRWTLYSEMDGMLGILGFALNQHFRGNFSQIMDYCTSEIYALDANGCPNPDHFESTRIVLTLQNRPFGSLLLTIPQTRRATPNETRLYHSLKVAHDISPRVGSRRISPFDSSSLEGIARSQLVTLIDTGSLTC
jgi:hypothetical protein